MVLQNNWDCYKIENVIYDFSESNFITITFDFEVLKSYDYLENPKYSRIELVVENNLPYTMLLKKIFEKCEETIDNTPSIMI